MTEEALSFQSFTTYWIIGGGGVGGGGGRV